MRAGCGVRAVVPACLALLFLARPLTAGPASRPNLLIAPADDQGLGDFSGAGNSLPKTPVLDPLRERAVRLSGFHSAPMCTPTRGQLMTGMEAVRNGAAPAAGGRSFIRPGIPTTPEIPAAAGNDLCGACCADIAYIPSAAVRRSGNAAGGGAPTRERETAR